MVETSNSEDMHSLFDLLQRAIDSSVSCWGTAEALFYNFIWFKFISITYITTLLLPLPYTAGVEYSLSALIIKYYIISTYSFIDGINLYMLQLLIN